MLNIIPKKIKLIGLYLVRKIFLLYTTKKNPKDINITEIKDIRPIKNMKLIVISSYERRSFNEVIELRASSTLNPPNQITNGGKVKD
jgi:hypothetical protein